MDLDERHSTAVAGEDRERRGTQVFAAQGLSVGCDRRDGRWAAAVCDTEAVHDVLGVDAGPHDDAEFGELGPDVRELAGQGALRIVELCGLLEQDGALRMERGEFAWAMRETPVARRIANCGHVLLPKRKRTGLGGSHSAVAQTPKCCSRDDTMNLATPCATYPALRVEDSSDESSTRVARGLHARVGSGLQRGRVRRRQARRGLLRCRRRGACRPSASRRACATTALPGLA